MLDSTTSLLIVVPGIFGIIFAYFQFTLVAKVNLEDGVPSKQLSLIANQEAKTFEDGKEDDSGRLTLIEIYETIVEGADSFLKAEYRICTIFVFLFGLVVFVLTSSSTKDNGDHQWDFTTGAMTAVAFAIGAFTSMLSGYIGMKVAVYSNARTSVSATYANPWKSAFNTAFRAGSVMGFSLCGLALLCLYAICAVYNTHFGYKSADVVKLFEAVAGFGLGGSSIAMFGRVGGGIYTKAADVGADLAGKVIENLDEDDPRNPATIADNVGDNVGDVAGMGSDLFGSFAEASCAALVVIASVRVGDDLLSSNQPGWKTLMFPLLISAVGILCCAACTFIATHVSPVRVEKDVEKVLKVQLLTTTAVITAAMYPLANFSFGDSNFYIARAGQAGVYIQGSVGLVVLCVCAGLWAGCAIGFITEYYTSHSYRPTRELSEACNTAATNIIYGLALGYKSVIVPVILLAAVVWVSFEALDMLGVAFAALGMLSNLATCLSIDVYGPVCDNAGGIAEMAGMPSTVRDVTDALDAAGNTTAAIGKGFAIGSACLVGLALFGAFITRSGLELADVSLLDPIIFAFLLIGAMLPYWFSAMTMKAVGLAANEMVKEVVRQFKENPALLAGDTSQRPDYHRCIDISTKASLRMMIAPSVLVMTSPILTGVFFGTAAVAGLLSGAISSSIQMAISASNTGGAWDNAKKYIESGRCEVWDEDSKAFIFAKKHDKYHKNAVIGDTVGDPLKDTSGPALNIVMKLMAILSLVFADFFKSVNKGHGLIHWNNTL